MTPTFTKLSTFTQILKILLVSGEGPVPHTPIILPCDLSPSQYGGGCAAQLIATFSPLKRDVKPIGKAWDRWGRLVAEASSPQMN